MRLRKGVDAERNAPADGLPPDFVGRVVDSRPDTARQCWLVEVEADITRADPSPTPVILNEARFESLGAACVTTELGGTRLVAISSETLEGALWHEISITAFTETVDARTADRIRGAVEKLLEAYDWFDRIECWTERHWHEPHVYWIRCHLGARGDATQVFDRLVGSGEPGWEPVEDDGFFAEAGWSRGLTSGDGPLGVDVEHVSVVLHPLKRPARMGSKA